MKYGCEAFQESDQKRCPRCRLVWDMNDPEPPECLGDTQIAINEVNRAARELQSVAVDEFAAGMRRIGKAGRGLAQVAKEQRERNRLNITKLKEMLK